MADLTEAEYHQRLAREARRDAEACKRQAQAAIRERDEARAEADRMAQEAVAAALVKVAELAFYPSQKLRAKHGSNIHVACFETNTKIRALIPADAMQALEARDARVREACARIIEGLSDHYAGGIADAKRIGAAAIREGGE